MRYVDWNSKASGMIRLALTIITIIIACGIALGIFIGLWLTLPGAP